MGLFSGQHAQRLYSETPQHQTPYKLEFPQNLRAFAHGVMGRRIDPSWDGPIELFLVPVSAPRLV